MVLNTHPSLEITLSGEILMDGLCVGRLNPNLTLSMLRQIEETISKNQYNAETATACDEQAVVGIKELEQMVLHDADYVTIMDETFKKSGLATRKEVNEIVNTVLMIVSSKELKDVSFLDD